MIKAWYQSKTIRSAFLAWAIATGTVTLDCIDKRTVNQQHLMSLVGSLIAFYKVVEGRSEATSAIWTPKGIPGLDRVEQTVDQKIDEMVWAANTVIDQAPVVYAEQAIPETISELSRLQAETPTESLSTGEIDISIRYQASQANYYILATQDTVIKTSIQDSSFLKEDQIKKIVKDEKLNIFSYVKDIKNHIKVRFSENGEEFFVYIPHIKLINKKGAEVSLIDHIEQVQVVTSPKTAFRVPGYSTTLYLEDPVVPNGHIYWSEITRNNQRPLSNSNQVIWTVRLCEVMEKVRSYFGNRPITITSGYRPPHINAAAGGAKYSQHLYWEGAALDFYIDGVSESQVYNYLNSWWDGGLAIKPGVFTHIDNRPGYTANNAPRWNYP
jgi:hypothetical protein